MNPTRQSLTTSLNSDVTHYAVLCIAAHVPDCMPRRAYFAERTLEGSCSRSQTIEDIIAGQFGVVAKVFAFNSCEHIADDVTEEIAVEIANSLDPAEPISEQLHDFIERNAGQSFVRGLRLADRTFAAA